MSDGPTIGDWTQYEWIPDDASSFPARIRLRDAAWMMYYEPDISDIKAENAKLRELAKELFKLADRGLMELGDDDFRRIVDEAEKLGVEVDA